MGVGHSRKTHRMNRTLNRVKNNQTKEKKRAREGEALQVCWGNCSGEDLLPQD